jgi:hypothetical protein
MVGPDGSEGFFPISISVRISHAMCVCPRWKLIAWQALKSRPALHSRLMGARPGDSRQTIRRLTFTRDFTI